MNVVMEYLTTEAMNLNDIQKKTEINGRIHLKKWNCVIVDIAALLLFGFSLTIPKSCK